MIMCSFETLQCANTTIKYLHVHDIHVGIYNVHVHVHVGIYNVHVHVHVGIYNVQVHVHTCIDLYVRVAAN